MKTVKTGIYDEFTCIADQCEFTCCQEWKIAVDDDTDAKWKKIAPPADTEERKDNLHEYTVAKDGDRVIGLTKDHVCPFLNKEKLCKLVIEHGDGMLSKTCATFPREIHEFETRTEYTLMASCPAVLDLIHEIGVELVEREDGEAADFDKISSEALTDENEIDKGQRNDDGSKESFADEKTERDITEESETAAEEKLFFEIRDYFMEIMKDEGLTVQQALMMNFYTALELLEMDDAGELNHESFEQYKDSDILQELYETIEEMDFNSIYTFEERNELLLDLSENYRKEGLYQNLLEPICQRAEFYSKQREKDTLDIAGMEKKINRFQKRIAKSEEFIRDFLAEEIFADCYTPESTFECMVVKLQWLAMEYGAMMQAIFLYEELKEEQTEGSKGLPKAYPFEDLKKMIVLIFRMTGYDDEDIYEYLENSFEDLIWEWGYFALVVGEA